MTVERVPCENCGNMVARTSRFCPYCKSKNPNGGKNFLTLLIGIPMALIVGAGLIANGSHSHKDASTSNATVPMSSGPDGGETASADEPKTTQSLPPSPAAQSGDSDRDKLSLSPQQDVLTMSDAWKQAARQALESGQPARWTAEGETGYAVASSAQTYLNQTCKSYRVTSDKGETLADKLACRSGESDWDVDAKRS